MGGTPMSPVDFKKFQSFCRLFIPLLHVDIEKWPVTCHYIFGSPVAYQQAQLLYRPVEFRGQGPFYRPGYMIHFLSGTQRTCVCIYIYIYTEVRYGPQRRL